MERIPNTPSDRNERNLVKFQCHSCKCESALELLVPCKNSCCGLLYCRKCLTSRYKYSRAKAANLPTLSWRCPVCTCRCFCDNCVETGATIQPQKVINKTKSTTGNWYRKKRIRKAKKFKLKRRGLHAEEARAKVYFSPYKKTSGLPSANSSAAASLDPRVDLSQLPPIDGIRTVSTFYSVF